MIPLISSISLLILGLPNPNNLPEAQVLTILVTYLIGMISMGRKYAWMLTLAIGGSFFAVNKLTLAAGIPSLIMGVLLAAVFRNKRINKKWAILPVLIALLACASVSGDEVISILKTDPKPKSYVRDMGLYLETFYLMKTAIPNYYQAHGQALLNHAEYFDKTLPKDVWSWRLPTVFWVWYLLPSNNGVVIYMVYVGLTLLMLLAAAEIGKYFWPNGYFFLLLPYLLLVYFRFPLRDWTILQVEWWSALFWIFGVWGLIKKNYLALFGGTLLSIGIRELMVVPLLLAAFTSLVLRKRRELTIFALTGIVFAVFLLWHSHQIGSVAGALIKTGFNPRLNGSTLVVQATLAFGSWEFLFNQWRIFTLMWILAFFGYLSKPSFQKLILASPMTLTVFYLKFATGVWSHVWGVLYMPSVLLGVFILFSQISSLGNKKLLLSDK